MSKIHQRIFIAIDEWAGVLLCVYLWHAHREAFWPVLKFWAICVYAVAYPSYFGWWSWVWDQFVSITNTVGNWWRYR